jgi:D-alanyl-D-alanine carboxypeptidase (penicillin-binding protein 5/6)
MRPGAPVNRMCGSTARAIASLLAGVCVVAAPARAAAPAPAAPPVAAQTWLLMDHTSGQVLLEHAGDKPTAPASLTKLMTAYLLFEKLEAGTLRVDERIKISPHAAATNGSSLHLAPGAEVALDDLLKGMLVRSANDATVALAEHAGGDEARFVAAMNARAQQLGLAATHFNNPTGLDHPAQRSTARDMTRLASLLIRDFPELYKRYFGLREFTFHGARQYNRNLLLWRDDTVDGIKTGRTQAAGHCLIASALRRDMRLVATVLGAQDEDARVRGAEWLLNYGFDHFETYMVQKGGQPATNARVWLGAADTVPVGVADSRYVTLPRGAEGRLQRHITVAEEVYAPIRAGQTLGALRLDYDGRPLAEYPLVALADLAPGNFVQRAFDQLQLWFALGHHH